MMEHIECEVLIVGAGPAGSTAARKIAERGVDVLVIDKKQEIGAPKRCGEGLNIGCLKKTGVDLDRCTLKMNHGVNLFSPSGKCISVKDPPRTDGYVLERKIFEKELARLAIRAGARYMVKTQAKGVIKEEGYVRGVIADSMDGELKIESKIVVGADGRESLVGRMAGMGNLHVLRNTASGFQYEMVGVKLHEDDMSEIYVGNRIAPRGYTWIFPKDEEIANVGIGLQGGLETAKHYLDKWIAGNPYLKGAQAIEVNAGSIPTGGSIGSLVDNGIMLVGDAAHQVNPIHGGGMEIAIGAAEKLAQVAAAAVERKDYSRKSLAEYNSAWKEEQKKMDNILKIRLAAEKLSDEQFDMIFDILDGGDIVNLTQGKYLKTMAKVMGKAPALAGLLKSFLF